MPGLIVDIVDLPRATGSVKNLQIRTPAPADLGTEVIGVPEGSDLALDVTLTSMDDGVLAHADADLHVHGECVRCLRDLDEDRSVRIDELYVFPEVIEAQRAEGDEEAEDLLAVGETTLDLEPALRDALVPTLPFQPLCRPDCPGLCPDCGKRLGDRHRSGGRAGRAHEQGGAGLMAKRRSAPPARTDTEALVYRWGPSIDAQLLDLALTHRSYAHENGGLPTNERLEFLGDSVLGIIVTEYLYRTHPEVPEGQLAKMRAATVSEPALAAVARDLGLGEFIKLGKGEALSGGRDKDSILSDTVEALIGATYLTHGLEETRTVVTRLVSRFLDSARTRGAGLDWKTSLQELTAVHQLGNPAYEVTGTGPDHQRVFTASAIVDGEVLGQGTGSSKKVAEHDAAEAAYAAILAARGDGGLNLPGVNEALRADLLTGQTPQTS